MSQVFQILKSCSGRIPSSVRMASTSAAAFNAFRFKSKSKKQKKPVDTVSLAPAEVLATPEEIETKRKLSSIIEVPADTPERGYISGVPGGQLCDRRVRIHQTVKNAMQSGTHNVARWKIDYDTCPRWENPLMGWASTGDPLSNLEVGFSSQQEAISFCERYGWRWSVDTPPKPRKQRVKNYGINFAFNKRTRVQTK